MEEIMETNENLVTDVTENVETATEETVEQVETPAPRTYTQDEVNEIVSKRNARTEAKIRKEYNRKYGALENVLRAGTGQEDVEEMTNTFKEFYESKGITIPTEPTYSNKDIEALARIDADEIIKSGFDEVVEEADRLNEIGFDNMTAREKATFVQLTNHIKSTEASRELSKIGVTEDVYESKEFKDFASKFSSNTPITEIYEIFNKTQPKKPIKPMGSIKNNTVESGAVKDFYSREEALKFTKEDFDKNPELFNAVCNSMPKW